MARDYDKDLKDYVDVAERITAFRDKHPDGVLQSSVLRWPEEGFPFVAVEARAYRTADDERPGVGLAWENFPGLTPYTKNSELQNAETSAWGRAIVAVLAADTKRGIASKPEVNRASAPAVRERAADASGEVGAEEAVGGDRSPPDGQVNAVVFESMDLAELWAYATEHGITERKALAMSTSLGAGKSSAGDLDANELRAVLSKFTRKPK
jgi:hypothetical protein